MLRHEYKINDNILMDQNDDLLRKMEKYVKCPRCKNYLRFYRRRRLTLDKRECRNVCDHCLNEYLFRKPSSTHDKERKAIGREHSPFKHNKNKVKLWLSRIIDLLESNLILYKTANLSKQAEKKGLLSNESRYRSYRFHEPLLNQMFSFSRNHAQINESSEVVSKPQYVRYDIDGNEETHNKITFEKGLDNIASMDTFHDDVTISSTDSHSKNPLMLQEKLHLLKKVILEDSKEKKKSYGDKYRRVFTAKRRDVNYNRVDVRELPFKTQIEADRQKFSVTSLKRFNSLESLGTSILSFTEKTLEQNFSYFFPKEEQDKHPIRRHKSSSEIIKDTIDMLSERAELERKKRDEKLKKKLQEEEKTKLARMEKYKQKAEPENQTDTEEIKEVIFSTKDKEKTEKASTKSSKDTKSVKSKLNKAVKDITKSPELDFKKEGDRSEKEVLKENKVERPFKEKSIKDTEKSPKEDFIKDKQLRNEFKKSRDKSPKEDLDKEALLSNKEQKIKAKEEKEKLIKIEKAKKMQERAEKEEKLKNEKEEKERLKKEKAEQSLKEKERIQKEKSHKPSDHQVKGIDLKEKHAKGEKVTEKKDIDKGNSGKRLQENIEKKLKEEAYSKMAMYNSQSKPEPDERSGVSKPKKEEVTTFKELNISQVKLRKHSQDNLILQLVKLKQSERKEPRARPQRLSEINVSPIIRRAHKDHCNSHDSCILCRNSDLELDIDNILFGEQKLSEPTDLIMGRKIIKLKESPRINKTNNITTFEPLMFQSTFIEEDSPKDSDISTLVKSKPPPVSKRIDPEAAKGVIRYALSDRSFIDKGWTMLPTEKVVRKMNVYRMRPAHPEFDWFEHNKNKKMMHYDTGEKLAEFDDNGKGRWFYRNSRLALDHYNAEETNAQQRFVIYSNGEPDERGRPRPFTILATFDYLGNGVVFDHSGKIRLKYNQTEGVILDKSIGPVSHWKWHTLNDPPVLQQVMIDTQMAHKDPEILKLGGHGDEKPRQDNEEMLAIEFDNFIKEKSKKLTQKFKPFQIKMKALKINENFSLKVLDQATVYLIFRDGSTNLKLNIGMILDHKEIVDTDTAEVGEVSNSLERFPAKTDSLAGLQHSVAHAQRVERARIEREHRLRPTQSNTSADKLTAAASKPLRRPFRTTAIPSNPSINTNTTECRCKCRKPSTCNIYYDTRLV
ncbi:calponin homology domain-containing protein DDB_G0272472-like [Pieris rapae]|uniref:calponin homology domain-containing protein DDB_G0272472-like n=1 Tax=Pieris rapae TaxID=64459 RepID=UPI001E281729|nr:calponin homology domain-containing protein DDB_G0272472-like [Pieris rapae]